MRQKKNDRRHAAAVLALVLIFHVATHCDDALFPTPDNIRDNVAFWKLIFAEVSQTKGLLHDRDYPLIIYDTVTVGKLSGTARTNHIRQYRNAATRSLEQLTTAPRDTWGERERRIYAMFERHNALDDLRGAEGRVRFQQGLRERYHEGVVRSGMWMDTIHAILTLHNVPLRLAWLPHVESSFVPDAFSKAGAAGMWQFMPGTGKAYLTINYLVDERRDPVKSTWAAAQLLAHNYSQLGAWPLAITAYNHGLYGMKRAVAATGSNDIGVIIERHASRSFQFASKNFYSSFIAASHIAADPTPWFGEVSYKRPIPITVLPLEQFVTPRTLAEHFNISQATLARLNPSLRPVVFQQQKHIPAGFVLQLPATIAPEVALQTLASIPDSLLEAQPSRPSYYRVRRGDNLSAIAHRLGTTAQELASANSITRMNRIYEGQILQVPQRMTPVTTLAAAAPPRTPAAVPPPAAAPSPAAMDEEALLPGQESALPVAGEEAEADSVFEEPTPEITEPLADTLVEIAAATADTAPRAYPSYRPGTIDRFDAQAYDLEVKHGLGPNLAEIRIEVNETVGHYADWLGVNVASLRNLNRMRSSSAIRIGSSFMIPYRSTETIERFIRSRLEYHMAIEEDFYQHYKVTDLRNRSVRRGETLWDICTTEGEIPLWLLLKHNKNLHLARLSPGMSLRLPIIEEKSAEDLAVELLPDRGVRPAVYFFPSPESGPFPLLP